MPTPVSMLIQPWKLGMQYWSLWLRKHLLSTPSLGKKQAVTLGMKSSVKIDGDQIQIDPQLLFQMQFGIFASSLSQQIFQTMASSMLQRHLPPVHWICDQEVRRCHNRLWWVWKTNTKDMTHQRLSKGNAVTFTANMPITMKKEQFLANRQNKQQFIFMLSEALQKKNCETHHASGDADLLIVLKAIQSATPPTLC